MAVTTEELVPALEDVRQAHAAVFDRFRADAAVTPPGPHRDLLERGAAEAQDDLRRVQQQVRDLRPRGALGAAAGVTRWVSRGAVRTVMLPVTLGSKAVRGALPGGGPADARQLLRNAEDEYAAAARALAACRAGEVLAEEADDRATAELLGSLRRRDEELLRTLEDSLTRQARAVAAAADGFRPGEGNGGGGLAGTTARTVRTVVGRARDLTRRGDRRTGGPAGGADLAEAETGPVREQVLGAVRHEDELPIHGFSQLSTEQIKRRLPALSPADLAVIETYERTHAHRKGVLGAIERLRRQEP
jgi:hypothetical protein